MRLGVVPDGLVGSALADVELLSSWVRPRGAGCELSVRFASGHAMFVVVVGIDAPEAELARWRARRGVAVQKANPVALITLEDGGQQQSLEVVLADGHRFDGDVLEIKARTDEGPEDLPEDYVFEGTPGVEMGEPGDGQGPIA